MTVFEKLKPCPFCGEEEDIDYGTYNGTLKDFDYVQCQNCGAEVNAMHKGDYIAAEKIWNTRANERNEVPCCHCGADMRKEKDNVDT